MYTVTTMSEFFSEAGELNHRSMGTSGTAPTRTFSVKFWYDYGVAIYDGRQWTFKLMTKQERRRAAWDRWMFEKEELGLV